MSLLGAIFGGPTPTPTPAPAPAPPPTPAPNPTPTPVAAPNPAPTPEPTPVAAPTPAPTATPAPVAAPTSSYHPGTAISAMPDFIRAQAVADDYQVEADAAATSASASYDQADQLIRYVRGPQERVDTGRELSAQTSQDILQQATQALVAQAGLTQSSVLALLMK